MARLSDEQFLERLFDEIGESILNATDEEILEDARLTGEDIEKTAAETRGVLKRAVAAWRASNATEPPK